MTRQSGYDSSTGICWWFVEAARAGKRRAKAARAAEPSQHKRTERDDAICKQLALDFTENVLRPLGIDWEVK